MELAPSREAILEELRRVMLPDGKDIVALDLVKALTIDGAQVSFVLEVPGELGNQMEPVRAAAADIVRAMDGVERADVVMTAHMQPRQQQKTPPNLRIGRHPRADDTGDIKGVKSLIAVGSGKGGVGKSTVAANLVLAMNMIGHDVGLLDADIHGPSIPIMMGVRGKPASPDGKTIIPLTAHGIKFMSMGSLLPAEQAVIWRGPMLMGALQQMLQQVQWGALDVLVVDLPPGTGDVQLTLCQKFKPHGAVIVTTPQDVALADARRAVSMFRELKTPVLGLIENMSHFVCPHCGKETDLFGRSGARKEAEHQRIPFLGTIPMDAGIVQSGDRGEPAVLHNKDLARVFQRMAERLTQNGLGGV